MQRLVRIAISVLAFFAVAVFRPTIVMEENMIGVIHPTVMLAIGVWMEARGEPYEGKLAVAYTMMNRVRDTRWPDTVSDVLMQAWQFSWANPGDPNRLLLDDINWNDTTFDESYKAACTAYYLILPDVTHGANHYINPKAVKKLPSWYDRNKIVRIIGNHEFLRL
jgi:spore germination cell wall hydrolase CwlJ-like protein